MLEEEETTNRGERGEQEWKEDTECKRNGRKKKEIWERRLKEEEMDEPMKMIVFVFLWDWIKIFQMEDTSYLF